MNDSIPFSQLKAQEEPQQCHWWSTKLAHNSELEHSYEKKVNNLEVSKVTSCETSNTVPSMSHYELVNKKQSSLHPPLSRILTNNTSQTICCNTANFFFFLTTVDSSFVLITNVFINFISDFNKPVKL